MWHHYSSFLLLCCLLCTASGLQSPHRRPAASSMETILFPYDALSFESLTAPIRWLVRPFFFRGRPQKLIANHSWNIASMPTYANWTGESWNAHIHGNAWMPRPLNEKQANKSVERVLWYATMKKKRFLFQRKRYYMLNAEESTTARERVRSMSSYPMKNTSLTASFGSSCRHTPLDNATVREGGFLSWVKIPPTCLPAHLSTNFTHLKQVKVEIFPFNNAHVKLPDQVAANVSLIPQTGLTIVSDVDDVLRVAEVWNIKQAILSTIARPFKPWLDMPHVFAQWKEHIAETHFHYLSDTPEIGWRFYVDGTTQYYPSGSWDFRAMDWSGMKYMFESRKTSFRRLFQSFLNRRFVIVGDTSTESVMRDYPRLMSEFPNQVQCILIRDVEATEPSDWRIPTTYNFLKLPYHKYFFFRVPSDLYALSVIHLNALAKLPIGSFYRLENPITLYTNLSQIQPTIRDLTSVSLSDLSSRPLDTVMKQYWYRNEGCFPQQYIPNSTFPLLEKYGFFGAPVGNSTKPIDSMVPTRSRLNGLKSMLRAIIWRMRCDIIPISKRPSRKCKYDLRQGEGPMKS